MRAARIDLNDTLKPVLCMCSVCVCYENLAVLERVVDPCFSSRIFYNI